METVTLGRTGLKVSVAGLGCGGHSRLGQSQGRSFDHSVRVVQAALDAGVSFIDTAAAYGTEEIVGHAVRTRRDQVVLSSKQAIVRPGTSGLGQDFLSGAEFEAKVEENLRRLNTDYIDIFHPHGIMPDQYPYCRDEILPSLIRLREAGKIRYLGITERFIHDTGHKMLAQALADNVWDVVMTGFNMLNPSARDRVFAQTQANNVGTLVMFAVRRALGSADCVQEAIAKLSEIGAIDPASLDAQDPLGFLSDPDVAHSVIEAAYRFCRHEPGAHVVLTGTGSTDHLAENLRAIAGPALPQHVQVRLRELFGGVDQISGN